jgi:hypothetical protein
LVRKRIKKRSSFWSCIKLLFRFEKGLLEIIDKTANSIDIKLESKPVIDYVDVIFKDEKIVNQEFFEKTYAYKFPKILPFYETEPNLSGREADKKSLNEFLSKHGPLFLTTNNKTLLSTFEEMVNQHCSLSSDNNNGGNLDTLVFESDKVEKLLKKCKADNFKLTGVINMLLVLAFKIINEKHGNKLSRFAYMNSISLRQFLPAEVREKAATFSYMANVVPTWFDLEEKPIEYLLANFWSMAKLESNTLHQKIANNQQFVRWNRLKYRPNKDELSCIYYLSNIGAYMKTLNFIDLTESYMTLRYNKSSCNTYDLHVSCMSINNRLCWSFYYHMDSFDPAFLSQLKQLIVSLSDSILEKNV